METPRRNAGAFPFADYPGDVDLRGNCFVSYLG